MTTAEKLWVVCAKCGSDEVLFDALAEWDKEAQKFVLRRLLDHAECEDCGTTKIKEIPAPDLWDATEPLSR